MNPQIIKIAICRDEANWHTKFCDALEKCMPEKRLFSYEIINIDTNDWISKIQKFDVIMWKPHNMGVESASYFKEKIYFIEKHLGKLIVPNYNTIWHFESKVAQSYIFERYKINKPRTVATFDYYNALEKIKEFKFPVVFKKSSGASSVNVRLVKTHTKAAAIFKRIFCRQLIKEMFVKKGPFLSRFSCSYIWAGLDSKLFGVNQRVAYWQEFIPDNSADLRITVIGNKYAFGFWRKNRPGDFRASGSGNIDFETPVPDTIVKYCMNISSELDFDSMAYDILFTNDSFVIVEMSYGYIDTAVYKSNGYYELIDGELKFNEGNYWPQEIWVRWALTRITNKFDIKRNNHDTR